MRKTIYLYKGKTGKRTILLCPPCAKDAKGDGKKVRKLKKSEFDSLFTCKVCPRHPAFCSNCEGAIADSSASAKAGKPKRAKR
jgi:hypothetical protein